MHPELLARIEAEVAAELSWFLQGRIADSQVELTARDTLRAALVRHGLRPGRVTSRVEGGGLVLTAEVAPSPARVTRVQLRFG